MTNNLFIEEYKLPNKKNKYVKMLATNIGFFNNPDKYLTPILLKIKNWYYELEEIKSMAFYKKV